MRTHFLFAFIFIIFYENKMQNLSIFQNRVGPLVNVFAGHSLTCKIAVRLICNSRCMSLRRFFRLNAINGRTVQ